MSAPDLNPLKQEESLFQPSGSTGEIRTRVEQAAEYPTDEQIDSAVSYLEGQGWQIRTWDYPDTPRWLSGAKFARPCGYTDWRLLKGAIGYAKELGWDGETVSGCG